MSIQASPRDKIGLLSASSFKSSLDRTTATNFNAYTTESSSRNSTPKNTGRPADTIHYLSPATTRTGSEHEGDLSYRQFVHFRPPDFAAQQQDFDSGSASSRSSASAACDQSEPQRTLAIVKPEAVRFKDVVLRAVWEAGLKILDQRLIHLSPEQVSEIYAKHYGSPSFPHMVVTMNVSPVLVLALAGKDCVEKWKTMIGPYGVLREEWFFPYSVRSRFGILADMPDALHASENVAEGMWENRYFFPRSILEPLIIDEDKVADYVNNFVTPTLTDGLAQVVLMKPIDPIMFLAEWLLLNNPYQAKFPENVAVSPL
ncbi:unnamed protein product [Phaedon cochleariae]|uniref:Nucleoside diphosphate kinase-like domain-containing protein n=1 Tax=Phaedon cochleariae TaxID=80249 RepID=A0A9N9X4W3_PHACE|nr:unnamed protein product [Phaedon cochleariae]